MKVLPFKLPKPENRAFIYQVDEGAVFYNKFHEHKEIQITAIIEGEGELVTGDTVTRYVPGDVFVLGGHLPHLFRSDETASIRSEMRSVFFCKESFGKVFFDLIELKELESLFQQVEAGIRVSENREAICALLLDMDQASHLDRFIGLLELLRLISRSHSDTLASFVYKKSYTEEEGTRMSNVYEYAISHFREDISLATISDVANMTENAFCRYFKQRTNKTFFHFLGELRLDYACRLLSAHNDLSVAEIADRSGFRNLSNFNRQFRHYKGCTPTEFRNARVLS